MSQSWIGEDELNSALGKVAARNPPSRSGVEAVVKISERYIKEYKHIVYFVEKFITECKDKERVPVLYALDAILRHFAKTSKAEGDKLCQRLAKNLVSTLGHFANANASDKKSVDKVVSRWKAKGFFDSGVLGDAIGAACLSGPPPEKPQEPTTNANDVLNLLASATSAPPNNGLYRPQSGGNPSSYGHGPPSGYGPPRPFAPQYGAPPPPQPHAQYVPPGGQPRYSNGQQAYAPQTYAPQAYQPQRSAIGGGGPGRNTGPPGGEKPEVGTVCRLRITKVNNTGAFVVCIDKHEGHWGLVHKSALSTTFVNNPEEVVSRNQEVFAVLEKITPKRSGNGEDLSFSMKEVDQATGKIIPQQQAYQNPYQPQPSYGQPVYGQAQYGGPPPEKRQAVGTGDVPYKATKANLIPLAKTRDFSAGADPSPAQTPVTAHSHGAYAPPPTATTTAPPFRNGAPFKPAAPASLGAPFKPAAPASLGAPFKPAAPASMGAPFKPAAPAPSGVPFKPAVQPPFVKRKRESE